MILTCIFVGLVGLYTALAAVADIRLHRIPNYLTVPTAVLGLLFHTVSNRLASMDLAGAYGWPLWYAPAGFAVGFALLFIPWLFGGGGMGDVKLLAALGAWLGPIYMGYAFVVSVFLAAIMALGVLIKVACLEGVTTAKRRYLAKGKSTGQQKQKGKTTTRAMRVLPFAVPVALSTWIVLAWMAIRNGGQLLN